ncbi:MAG: hypothetical protein QXO97_10430 [Candidatus Nezhaarchaeales archaeon]
MIRCSVIKYRREDYILYPLGREKRKIKHLYGKEVYTLIIIEEQHQAISTNNEKPKTLAIGG